MGRKDKDNHMILKYTVRCIYGVRKQVFHEAPRTSDILGRINTSKEALN